MYLAFSFKWTQTCIFLSPGYLRSLCQFALLLYQCQGNYTRVYWNRSFRDSTQETGWWYWFFFYGTFVNLFFNLNYMCLCVHVWGRLCRGNLKAVLFGQSTPSQGLEKVLCGRPRQVDLLAREVTGKGLKASHLPRRKYEDLPKFFLKPCPVILVWALARAFVCLCCAMVAFFTQEYYKLQHKGWGELGDPQWQNTEQLTCDLLTSYTRGILTNPTCS